MAKYSYSTNEETYYGSFDTMEEACNEVAVGLQIGCEFWVGEVVDPPAPENAFKSYDWLEQVSCQDEYSIDCADGWDHSTKEQRAELDAEVRAVMAKWLDKYDLRPKFFLVNRPQKFIVTGSDERGTTYEHAR